jgi:hypothetical protein
MTYRLQFEAGGADDANDTDTGAISPTQRRAAEQRFRAALESELGDAALVGPIYTAYRHIVSVYGDDPASDALSDAERQVLTQWQAAESAAVVAAFGPNRYMDEPRFEIIV